MPERAYTVAEIDRMRAVIHNRMKRPSDRMEDASGHTYFIQYAADPAKVEDQLRTYMLAGVSPEELDATRSTDPAAPATR